MPEGDSVRPMKRISLALCIGATVLGCSAWDIARVARIAVTGDVASA